MTPSVNCDLRSTHRRDEKQ